MRQAVAAYGVCGVWREIVESNHAEGEAITLPHSLRTAVLSGAVPKSRIKAARKTLVICTHGQHRTERFRMFGGCIASVGLFGSADTTTIPQVSLKCR